MPSYNCSKYENFVLELVFLDHLIFYVVPTQPERLALAQIANSNDIIHIYIRFL